MEYIRYKTLINTHTQSILNNPLKSRRDKEDLRVSKEKLKRVLLKMKNDIFGGEVLYVRFRLQIGLFEVFIKNVHQEDISECFKFAFSDQFIEVIEVRKIKLGKFTQVK